MKKEFIPYEQALALKELGFNEPCIAIYSNANPKTGLYTLKKYRLKLIKQASQKDKGVKAPLYQQVFRWFREKHVLLGFIEPANGYEDKSLFAFYICDDEQNIIDDEHSYSKDSSLHYKTYEEAELACLTKLIEIKTDLDGPSN